MTLRDGQLRSARGARAIVVRSLRRFESGASMRARAEESPCAFRCAGTIPWEAWRLESRDSGFTCVGLPAAEPVRALIEASPLRVEEGPVRELIDPRDVPSFIIVPPLVERSLPIGLVRGETPCVTAAFVPLESRVGADELAVVD
ncbi:MAG: hypothetical protein M9885_04795 [Burkholderiaceae bacterium]|nr:hypothetical protein [Burkholderiaceae bacterium]